MIKKYPRYHPKRGWTMSEIIHFVHPSTKAGAAAALRAAQEHYGAERVIEVHADGYVRNDRAQGTFYKPLLRSVAAAKRAAINNTQEVSK